MAEKNSTASQTLDQTLDLIQEQLDILAAEHKAIPTLLVTMSGGENITLEARGVRYLRWSDGTPPRGSNTPQTFQ